MTRANSVAAGVAAAVLLSGAIAWFLSADKMPGQRFALLTASELADRSSGAASDIDGAELGAPRALKLTRVEGPSIKVAAPSGFSLNSPVDFDIAIEPRNGVAVDMSSLRIEYRLGPGWVNVTRRILKRASVTGSRLYARGAELPPGKHAVRLSVRDVEARLTQALVSFSVAE